MSTFGVLLILAAGPAEPSVAAFVSELVATVGPQVRVTRDGTAVRLAREVQVTPANAPSSELVETHDFVVTLTIGPFLDEKAQAASARTALAAERTAWRAVAALQCDGMEFTDRYLDGLCFRAKSDAQQKRVAQYRAVRGKWLGVPRFHRAREFSVALRVQRPELIAGCSDCDALEAKVRSLLTAYPE